MAPPHQSLPNIPQKLLHDIRCPISCRENHDCREYLDTAKVDEAHPAARLAVLQHDVFGLHIPAGLC